MDKLRAGRELSLCVKAPKEYGCLEGSPGQWQGRMLWNMSSVGRSSFWLKISSVNPQVAMGYAVGQG